MNILFSCAGRRNYLIRFFRDALKGSGKVVATDMNFQTPAMSEADVAEITPEIYHDDYVDRLLEICQKHDIQAIIPLNDLDLPVLAAAKDRFIQKEIVPVVSDPSVVDLCFDKWKTFDFFNRIGIQTPQTYKSFDEATAAIRSGRLRFPLVVKPRWGSGSIAIEFAHDNEELNLVYPLTVLKVKRSILHRASSRQIDESVLIQEKIDGLEFGLDVMNDLAGNYVATITKQKLAMRAGETDKAVTVTNRSLQKIGETLGTSLRHVANLDCDVFEKENTGTYYALDLNPRFGGGYPFSHMAGVDLPAAILDWLQDKPTNLKHFDFQSGVAYTKCDTLIQLKST